MLSPHTVGLLSVVVVILTGIIAFIRSIMNTQD